jgi:hypothetical protein
MPFNLKTLKSNIADFGYLKQNKFEVFVKPPKILENTILNSNGREIPVNVLNNMMRYRIEQVTVPGVSLLSSDVHRYAIGPTQKIPYNAQFYDTTFSVLVDRNTDLWDFWYNWVNSIFNFNGLEPTGNNLVTGSRIPTYTARYKDDYSTIMMIVIYNDAGETVKTINLYDAFPSSVRPINFGWNDNTSLLRLSVSITYSSYTIVGSNVVNNANRTSTNGSSSTLSSRVITTP